MGDGEIDLEEPELCSSDSGCEVVDGDEKRAKTSKSGSKPVDKEPSSSNGKKSDQPKVVEKSSKDPKAEKTSKSATKERLPPGWIKMASKSHPGAFYYAHPASKRTQAHPPKTMYLGLPEPSATPLTLMGTPLPGAKVQKAAEEAKEAKEAKARAEAAKAQRAKEEALRKQQERNEKLKKAEEEAKVESRAAEEVIRKAREKRKAEAESQSQFEAVGSVPIRPKREKKAVGIHFDRSKQEEMAHDSDGESEELDLEKLKKKFRAKVEARNLELIPDLDFSDEPLPPLPPPPPLAPLPPPPLEETRPAEVTMDKKDTTLCGMGGKEDETKSKRTRTESLEAKHDQGGEEEIQKDPQDAEAPGKGGEGREGAEEIRKDVEKRCFFKFLILLKQQFILKDLWIALASPVGKKNNGFDKRGPTLPLRNFVLDRLAHLLGPGNVQGYLAEHFPAERFHRSLVSRALGPSERVAK
eukprot:s3054_g4.t1